MQRLKCGFTLVEMLVAIAIVTLVAAIMVPVFAQVRERAQQGACLSNLRQLGQALSMYREDHESYPPFVIHAQAVMPYVKSQQLFLCPSWQDSPGIQVISSYIYLLNGDRLWGDNKGLGARSVIMYCDSHRTWNGFIRPPFYSGVYTVLRHDGATEIIPTGKVKVSFKRMTPPGGQVESSVEVLEFPE